MAVSGLIGFVGVLTTVVAFGIGLLVLWLVCKLLKFSVKIIWKLVINALIGAAVLIVLNLIGGFFGLIVPITFLSALVTGFFGIPGVIVLVLIALL